nr:Eco57I restriction-modification methylase domain-containing protein [Treponema sp.]
MEKGELRILFESEYPGKKAIFEKLIQPIFKKAKDTTLSNEIDITEGDKKQIKSFSIIAQVRGGFPIAFADVEVQDSVALKRSRVTIQNCVRKMMENDSNAIIFFHFSDDKSEWRVSFCHRADKLKESTNAKRFTYLCGTEHACRTIAERFETLKGLSTIKDDDLLEAFSVEPLSKEFFDEYREHYADLVEYISGKRFVKKGGKFVEEKTKNAAGAFREAFEGDDKKVRDFVKKMMGRLVFLQFLQKKGWLGVQENAEWGSGDKNFIYNLFRNASKDVQNDFLEKALEPLFFKSLNQKRDEKAIAPEELCDIYGSKIRIPYLNGGLFEEDELDKKKVKFKKEHFEQLLTFFNQYNFTIDETDGDDQEIGVDPEMLGKIFENLLEDNKDKGAFYTPKEIVQYMCRESLIAYLQERSLSEEERSLGEENRSLSEVEMNGDSTTLSNRIRNFVLHHAVSDFSEGEKAALLKALLDVKICDPAVGSGAFPMGMMNELLACTQVLTGNAKSRSDLKKHIVRNNIYGVDIEKGAVDIARLRFWLAIIVDEKEPLPLPNLDYKIMQGNSLLESFNGIDLSDITKREKIDNDNILEGDDLLTEEERLRLQTNVLIDAFEYNMKEYFDTNDHKRKAELKNEIDDFVKIRVLNNLGADCLSVDSKIAKCDLNIKEAKKILQFVLNKDSPIFKKQEKIIAQNEEKKAELLKEKSSLSKKHEDAAQSELNAESYFLWHTWFGDVFNRPDDRNGFDIVIGNPPYISAPTQIANENLSNQRNRIIDSKKYKSLYQKWDLYIPFIELGTQLNCQNGITTMIVPFPLTNQLYAKVLRKMLVEENDMFELVDLNGTKIFDNATVSNCIPFIKKVSFDSAQGTNRCSLSGVETSVAETSSTWISKIDENLHISRTFEQTKSDLVQDEKTYVWNVTQEKRETNRHADMHVLGDYCYISVGMVLNSDESAEGDKFVKADLISHSQDEIHCKKYIEGKDLDRYSVKRVRFLEYGTERSPSKLRRPTFEELYTNQKLLINSLG